MRLDSIVLSNFRNYLSSAADFGSGINVITGRNAQGKTNLLESVYFISGAKSFRTRRDIELIRFDSDNAAVDARLFSAGREQNINIKFAKGGRKQILINSVKKKRNSELLGIFCVILFSPEDLEIIRGGAAERRRFMDAAISQLRPRYADALAEYSRLYEHKTRILRDYKLKPSLLEILDDFNARMIRVGAELILHRAAWNRLLRDKAFDIHRDISGGTEELLLEYKTQSMDNAELLKFSEIVERLTVHQKNHRQTELDSGLCLSGAHKDDILIAINGKHARDYASQGQVRTCALSLKLAERDICAADIGEAPVLLLDDVLSELDAFRQDFVLNRIKGGQVLITCCEVGAVEEKTGGKIFVIENGRIL